MATDYGPLVMFLAGIGAGYVLDRFRRFLDAWAERQQEILDSEGRR